VRRCPSNNGNPELRVSKMLTNKKFALVIPTLNEAGNIQPLLSRIQAALDPEDINYEVIIVDDGSSD